MSVRLSRSNISRKEIEAVIDVLEVGYLAMGKQVHLFEKNLAEFIGGEVEVACVNSGTAALHLACQAIGLRPGDEVLVPSLTYVASFQAISATGAKPVACDVELETGNLSLEDARTRISSKTKAIMYVHYASNPGNADEILNFCRNNNLRLIEDAAHSFGCLYKNQKIGSFGDVTCFSFDGIKNITSGEGGAVVSLDQELIQKVKDARLLGVCKDSDNRILGQRSWTFNVTEQGWRYHMSELMAAIGRAQLERFKNGEISDLRVSLADTYRNNLKNISGIRFLNYNKGEGSKIIPHILPILVDENKREDLKTFLKENGVESGFHYYPSHLLDYFKTSYALPTVEKMAKELVTLPLHTLMSIEDVEEVCVLVKRFMNSEKS